MAAHSSILAWKIPQTAEPVGYRPWGHKESDTTERLHFHWIMEKAREFQENIYFCFVDYAKAFDCVDHNKLWKILKEDGNTKPPDLPLEKPICRSGSNS